jgi:hypothetical protein
MCSPEVPDDPELAEWLPKFGMKPAFTPAVLAVGLTEWFFVPTVFRWFEDRKC